MWNSFMGRWGRVYVSGINEAYECTDVSVVSVSTEVGEGYNAWLQAYKEKYFYSIIVILSPCRYNVVVLYYRTRCATCSNRYAAYELLAYIYITYRA